MILAEERREPLACLVKIPYEDGLYFGSYSGETGPEFIMYGFS